MDIDDALTIIAESYRDLAFTQRLAVRLHAFALTLIGLALVGLGLLAWHTVAHREESAALQRALLTNTQTIAAQTAVLLARGR